MDTILITSPECKLITNEFSMQVRVCQLRIFIGFEQQLRYVCAIEYSKYPINTTIPKIYNLEYLGYLQIYFDGDDGEVLREMLSIWKSMSCEN